MFKAIARFCANVVHPEFHAGDRAEAVFLRQAAEARPGPWVMERISQAKETIGGYKRAAGRSVKRGDFICRNCCNAEIEVKCKTKYSSKQYGDYYLVEYSQIKRHEAMKEVTRSPVVFAFYERDGRAVLEGTLRMVDLDFLLRTSDYRNGKLYDRSTKCLRVPFRYTRAGFRVLEILGRKGSRRAPDRGAAPRPRPGGSGRP